MHIMDRMEPLDEWNDMEVADGNPDVRGWEVVGADGIWIGEVENLLIDRDAMKVRYLDVDLNEELFEEDSDRHVLIPIGHARLNEGERQVFVHALSSTDVGALPEYRGERLTREQEDRLVERFVAARGPRADPDSVEAMRPRRRRDAVRPHSPGEQDRRSA